MNWRAASLALILTCAWGSCAAAAPAESAPGISGETRITRVVPILRPPDSTQQARVTVGSSCVPGPAPGFFTYSYRLTNHPSARAGIMTFGVGLVPKPDSAFAPGQWTAFYGWQEDDSAVVWACSDSLTPPPAGWDSTNVYPSPYEIQPGRAATFRMVSRLPPAPAPDLRFCAQVFAPIPEAGRYSTGEIGPSDFPTLFRVGTSGVIIGPTFRGMPPASSDADASLAAPPGLPHNPTWGMLACVGYSLAKPASVQLVVVAHEGGILRVLAEGLRPAGYHSITWDGTDAGGQRVAPGEYVVRLEIGGRTADSRKLLVLH